MSLSDLVKQAFLAGALSTAGVGAGVVTVSVPAVAEAKELEELTPATFARRVYHNPKPVVVLFYQAERDKHGHRDVLEAGWRMETVVEELADKYAGQVAFFKVAIDHSPFARVAEWKRVFDVDDYSPLTVIYGRFDVLSGVQSLHNVKIDTVNGGPRLDVDVPIVIKNLGGYWIPTNLLGRDNIERDGMVYRAENTFEDWKTYVPGSALKR